jgi:nucleoside-diphosphate-sugar epimerase
MGLVRILVTGGRGRVGQAAVRALDAAGHDVTVTDLAPPSWDIPDPDAPAADRLPYVRADLSDYGEAVAVIGGTVATQGPVGGRFDAVVHAAAHPAPVAHPPHVVFANNMLGVFHVVEACVRWRVPRLVVISSETVPGVIFAERPFLPSYLPVDEAHPVAPQDPYALAKHFGEQLCDAAVRRSDLRVISLRPTWVQSGDSWARNLGPLVRDRAAPSVTGWAYVDADDLAEAVRLACESDLPGHEVMYVAAEDTVGGRDLHESWRAAFPDSPTELLPVPRPDAGGIDTSRARRLLGWAPRRTWRDHLDDEGRPLPR